MKFRSTIPLLTMLCLLAACAGTPAPNDAKPSAGDAAFTVKTGKANIYVYRNEALAAAVPITISLDGQAAGTTAANTYLRLEVAPGAHVLLSQSENEATLSVLAETGRSYFVWQKIDLGEQTARSQLLPVADAVGKAALSQCRPADTMLP